MNLVSKHFYSAFLLVALCLQFEHTIVAQSSRGVGININIPEVALDVHGSLQLDSALIVKPGMAIPAANAITVSQDQSTVIISATPGVQSNVVTVSGTPGEGQLLYILNTDDDDVSFANLSFSSGSAATFMFLSGTWRVLTDPQSDTDDQTLSFSGSTLTIDDGNSVNLGSLSDGTGTDDQTISLSGTNLTIEDGNTIDLSSIDTDTDTDDQTLSFSGSTLSIADGNSVNLGSLSDGTGTDDQTISLSGTNLTIEDGNTIDLSSIDTDTDTDDQTLSFSGSTLSIADGNSVNLGSLSDGTGTDDQTISLSGTNLTIEDGNTIDLSSIDTDTDTDDQTLSFSGSALSIADGNSVNLGSLSDGTGTDDQTISLSGTNLTIEDGNTIDLSSIDTDTDDQTLSLSGNNLTIADGNTVDLSGLNLNDADWNVSGNTMSNANSGNIGIGTTAPAQKLDIRGKAIVRYTAGAADDILQVSGYNQSSPSVTMGSTGGAPGAGIISVYQISGAQKKIQFSGLSGTDSYIDVTNSSFGVGTNSPEASAALDVSASDQGFLPPRLTCNQRDAIGSPAAGLMIFNTESSCLNFYDGTEWKEVCGNTASAAPSQPGSITGTSSTCNSSTETYSISPVSGATSYVWSATGGAIISSGQGTTSVTITFSSSNSTVSVYAQNACGNSASSSKFVIITNPTPGSVTFNSTGNFTIPAGVCEVTISAWGGGGGGACCGGTGGGGGGFARGTFSVSSGEIIAVNVGSGGTGGFGSGSSGTASLATYQVTTLVNANGGTRGSSGGSGGSGSVHLSATNPSSGTGQSGSVFSGGDAAGSGGSGGAGGFIEDDGDPGTAPGGGGGPGGEDSFSCSGPCGAGSGGSGGGGRVIISW